MYNTTAEYHLELGHNIKCDMKQNVTILCLQISIDSPIMSEEQALRIFRYCDKVMYYMTNCIK